MESLYGAQLYGPTASLAFLISLQTLPSPSTILDGWVDWQISAVLYNLGMAHFIRAMATASVRNNNFQCHLEDAAKKVVGVADIVTQAENIEVGINFDGFQL